MILEGSTPPLLLIAIYLSPSFNSYLSFNDFSKVVNFFPYTCKSIADSFGEGDKDRVKGLPSIPPSSVLSIDLELVSFKSVINVTGDFKVMKKILKEGEGALTANEGASVTSKYSRIMFFG